MQGTLRSHPNASSLVWAGPLQNNDFVVALVNTNNTSTRPISFNIDNVTNTVSTQWNIRDLWKREDIGSASGMVTYDVSPHDTVMLRLSKKNVSESDEFFMKR